MLKMHHTCQTHPNILQGSFHPEIFTARSRQEESFREATYPAEGLRMILTDVFSGLGGEHSAPALHRLETACGGGKTHTLQHRRRPKAYSSGSERLAIWLGIP
jgi:hypothetical protein